ncbi:MAG: PepSY-like domain-containing protein [Ginsengibacter sp.]
MKKILLPFALFIIISNACEQKFETWQVPKEVLHNFKEKYPSIEADWEIEYSLYEATFKTGGNNISLTYNKNGGLPRREKIMQPAELPDEIKNYLSQNYKDQKINKSKKITKNDGEIKYTVSLDGFTLTFNEKEELIKKTENH